MLNSDLITAVQHAHFCGVKLDKAKFYAYPALDPVMPEVSMWYSHKFVIWGKKPAYAIRVKPKY